MFVVLAVFVGGSFGTNTLKDDQSGIGESGRLDKITAKAFPDEAGESVLVQSKNGARQNDPAFRAAVADVMHRVDAEKGVKDIESPYAKGNEGQLSPDGRSALVTFDLPGDDDASEKLVDGPLAAVKAAERAHPGLRIEEFGDASADKAMNKAFEDDFKKAEITSLPITLIILILAFGALLAAFVPLVLAITAVAAAIGLIGPLSQIWPVDEAISSVVLLIGLAVGVDYSMFYLRREREERAAGTVRGGGAGRGLGHLRARRAHLRHHRDDRHGRDVLRRSGHVQLVRHGHDPRGGGGHDRIAHGPAGDPLEARRPGEQGPRALHEAGEAHGRGPRVGVGPRPGAQAPARVRDRRHLGAGGAGHPADPHPHGRLRRGRTAPQPGRDADLRPHAGRVPR